MRKRIFRFLVEKVGKIDQGQMLPRWLIFIRYIFFPLDSFYWSYSGRNGYQVLDDSWIIHGVKYSDQAMRALADSKGEIYRIIRIEDRLIVERISRP